MLSLEYNGVVVICIFCVVCCSGFSDFFFGKEMFEEIY